MTNSSENNRRIAKNALMLYFRMFLTMSVALYTSRVVLATLGVEDYGIYNAVGGIVTLFGFINSSMAASTQRYLTFELGRGNSDALNRIFSSSLIIHGLLSLLIFFLAETVGLWFLYTKMIVPVTRMEAALWVFHFSILTTLVSIMSIPYNATLIAHERMSAFAYISIIEVVLKLLIVYLLQVGEFDKLKLYAILMFTVQLGIRMIYGFYCSRHFMETKFRFVLDRKLFRDMLSFAGWNLWGSCASIAFTQGLNILLNIFFGPVVNAARGIAVQVQSAVIQFAFNFQNALNPQITKSYASNNFNYMHSLIYRSSKLTFFLLLFLSLPIFVETETILTLWLKTVPDYTIAFVRLMLCVAIIDAVANPLMVSAAATGKVKVYQSVVGGILLSILPISYVVLKCGGNPASVFVVHLCICVIAFAVRLYIVRPLIKLVVADYVRKVILRCISISGISIVIPILIKDILPNAMLSFVIVCFTCVLSVLLCSFCWGLDTGERQFIASKVYGIISKIKR